MKNLTKFGMMLLAAALCVGMSSCSDDDDKEVGVGGSLSFASNNPLISEGKKLLTRIECYEDGYPTIYTIVYDEHNRPVQVKDNDDYYTSVNYTDGTLYDENGEFGKATFTPEGYIKSISSNWSNSYSWSLSCTYDSERHLTKYDGKESGEEYLGIWGMTNVWKNGNLVQITAYEKDVENGIVDDEEWYEQTVEYFDKENKYRQLSAGFIDAIDIEEDYVAYAGLHGIGPKKLPKKIVWDNGETYTFEYILNADGSIRQETVTKNDDSDGYNYTKTYSYSYTPIE